MDPTDTNENNEQPSSTEVEKEEELSHSDKMIGVFTEPGKTFDAAAKHPPKTMDWLIPLISFLVIAIVSNFILFQNPEIKLQFDQLLDKQVAQVEDQLNERVQAGEMTESEKETALEQARGGIKFMTGPVMRTVTLVLYTIIGLFFMAFVYFLLSKFTLKGEGTYGGTLVARGLPVYILVVQIIVIAILSMVMNKLLFDSSAASFLDVERGTITSYLLGRIDPFAIWFYSVVGIGLAKMFKSESSIKYIIAVFVFWIIGDLILMELGIGFG
jgi:hypothetical protein